MRVSAWRDVLADDEGEKRGRWQLGWTEVGHRSGPWPLWLDQSRGRSPRNFVRRVVVVEELPIAQGEERLLTPKQRPKIQDGGQREGDAIGRKTERQKNRQAVSTQRRPRIGDVDVYKLTGAGKKKGLKGSRQLGIEQVVISAERKSS